MPQTESESSNSVLHIFEVLAFGISGFAVLNLFFNGNRFNVITVCASCFLAYSVCAIRLMSLNSCPLGRGIYKSNIALLAVFSIVGIAYPPLSFTAGTLQVAISLFIALRVARRIDGHPKARESGQWSLLKYDDF